jgi:hypothetical protein
MIFGTRYWTFLFWLNVGLAVAHALKGNDLVFLALGMAVVSKAMIYLSKNTEK